LVLLSSSLGSGFLHDLKLLFNRNVPKSSYKSKKKVTSTNISNERGKRKLMRQLLQEEHEALQLSQSSDLESTLSTLSSSLHNPNDPNAPLAFRFNSRARKRLREELNIDEEHIEWHEHEAPIDASCHSITALYPKNRMANGQPDEWSNVCRKSVIVSILALALNQAGSPIQIGDILRWINEGHLPFHDLEQLLPDELDPACYSETLIHLSTPNMAEMRSVASLLSRDLGIIAVEPDLRDLCRRYLDELALPQDLDPYIVKLIAIGPTIKQDGTYTHFPAYEQHAMKYILFVMKLLFGLDGVIETKMDALSEKVNNRLSETPEKYPKLFVWHEWQQYVAMRGTILEQLHYPTNQQRANYRKLGNTVDSELFLDFSASYLIPDDDNTTGYRAPLIRANHGQAEERRFKNIHSIIATTTDTQLKKSSESSMKNICFEHSLQPQRSYLAEVLNMQEFNQLGIYIPDYIRTDHSKRTTSPFVNPMPLKQHLLKHHRVRLKTKAIKPPISHIRMENVGQHMTNSAMYLDWREFTRVLLVDAATTSDSEDLFYETNILDYIDARVEAKMSSHEELLHQVTCRNILENIQSDLNASIKHAEKLIGGVDQVDNKSDPFRNNQPIHAKLPDEEFCNEILRSPLSNFHYWVRSLPHITSARKFFEFGYFQNFPNSFKFLLSEAAYVARCSPYELYCKLDALEKHFFKHYEHLI
uniref:Rrn7/TAF1B C-terminal cyclin domain-containing protein n=1 Tax=Anopheles atroparvus TaxID=41427 RepID=A0A182JKY3_ANOAO